MKAIKVNPPLKDQLAGELSDLERQHAAADDNVLRIEAALAHAKERRAIISGRLIQARSIAQKIAEQSTPKK